MRRKNKSRSSITEDCPLLDRPHQYSGEWTQDHTKLEMGGTNNPVQLNFSKDAEVKTLWTC